MSSSTLSSFFSTHLWGKQGERAVIISSDVIQLLELISLWKKHKGGEVLKFLLPHLNMSSHHSLRDFLKTLSTCCLGTRRKKDVNYTGNTHTPPYWLTLGGDKVLFWWWDTLRDTLETTAAAHTHTQPCKHLHTHTFKVRFLLHSAHNSLTKTSNMSEIYAVQLARLNIF